MPRDGGTGRGDASAAVPDTTAEGYARATGAPLLPARPVRRTVDVLEELVPLAGRRIVDVGCGPGNLVRHLARKGARVTGVECQRTQLDRARAAEPAGGEDYLEGVAEALPLEDAVADAIVFFQSLHHVPAAHMETALAEAARVLRPGGLLLVAEPIAEGAFFELVRPVDDETEVRRLALEALRRAGDHGLEQVEEVEILNPVVFRDFAAFTTVVVGADGDRAPVVERLAPELRARFEAAGRPTPDGRAFESPTRVSLLRRPPAPAGGSGERPARARPGRSSTSASRSAGRRRR